MSVHREKLHFEGDEFFEGLIAAIAGAKESVDLATYIFENGPLGERMVEALVSAVQRGAKVRLLVDGVGSLGFAYESYLRNGGVDFHYFHSLSKAWSVAKAVDKRGFFARYNRRNHGKMCIIDGEGIWLGGMNVSSLHLQSVAGKWAWRDTGIEVHGLDTAPFRQAFLVTWYDWLEPKRKLLAQKQLHEMLLPCLATSPLRTNSSRVLRRRFAEDLLQRIAGARERIWITTPYFIPPRPLLVALIQSRKKGVDVRLLLPALSDMKLVRWMSSLTYRELLKAGLRIYEYKPTVLHAKTMVIDDWSMIGSSNLNHRSALHDIEVNLASTVPSTVQGLARQYEVDLGQSREILRDGPNPVSLVYRLLSRLFVLFRYWM